MEMRCKQPECQLTSHERSRFTQLANGSIQVVCGFCGSGRSVPTHSQDYREALDLHHSRLLGKDSQDRIPEGDDTEEG